MPRFVAQRGELCLLTLPNFIALTELPAYVPVGQAAWSPESDHIVGYLEGEAVYRLVTLPAWTALLKEHRQRQVNTIADGAPGPNPPPTA